MARGRKKKTEPEVYTEEQLRLIEKHIGDNFGTVSNYFQNKEEGRIALNINVIPASRRNPYITLVTTGMGAHVMKAEGKSGEKYCGRGELVLCLPPGWKLDGSEPDAFWPVHLLDLIAEFSAGDDTWLSWGHTIDYGKNFQEQSGFRGVILLMSMFGKESWECKLSEDEEVTFYQVIPLTESELMFAEKNGSVALTDRMGRDFSKVADPERRSCVPDNFGDILDTVGDHACKIEEKELDISDINGADHIAAFLRWMIEHDMINDEFLDYFADEFRLIRSGELDIRKFLINSLDGELNKELFTEEGKAFSGYYYDFYGDGDAPCYPSDVDSMALDYFGEERYNSDEFSDEAYLFVPFDEAYFEHMSGYIDKAYNKFLQDLK